MFLDFGTVYAVREQARVIATAATLPYGRCAWISMVLVAGTHRRRGLATRLLYRCIADITAAGLVPVLDATPAGRAVYAPLGFQDSVGFHAPCCRTQRQSSRLPIVDCGTSDRRLRVAVPCAPTMRRCSARTGAASSPACAGACRPPICIAERDGRIIGLLLGRDGRTASHLGSADRRGRRHRDGAAGASAQPDRRAGLYRSRGRQDGHSRLARSVRALRRSARSPACCLGRAKASTTWHAPMR